MYDYQLEKHYHPENFEDDYEEEDENEEALAFLEAYYSGEENIWI